MATLQITEITVLVGIPSTDKIILHTELPSVFPRCEFYRTGFGTEVQKDTGIDYVFQNFDVDEVTVINCSSGVKSTVLRKVNGE